MVCQSSTVMEIDCMLQPSHQIPIVPPPQSSRPTAPKRRSQSYENRLPREVTAATVGRENDGSRSDETKRMQNSSLVVRGRLRAEENKYSPFPGNGCDSSDGSRPLRAPGSSQTAQQTPQPLAAQPHPTSVHLPLPSPATTVVEGARGAVATAQAQPTAQRRSFDPQRQNLQQRQRLAAPTRAVASTRPSSSSSQQSHFFNTDTDSVAVSPAPAAWSVRHSDGGSEATVAAVGARGGREGEECLHLPTSLLSSPTDSSSSSSSYLYLYKVLPRVSSETDYERLGRSMHCLQEGCFYYPDLDSDSARALLEKAPEGTFLVRDSSDAKFLFAITVKTARGATSVRIQYYRGFFQLDCEDQMKRKLPRFETLLDLVDFHVALSREEQGSQFRWLESSRRKDMVVRLTTPRRHSPPSLLHLARLAVNRNLQDLHLPSRSTDLLPLPESMKSLLRAYPFKV